MRTLKDIRTHYNQLYAGAEEGSIERICYSNIYRELRQHDTKSEAAKGVRFMLNVAPDTDKPYYQKAVDLLTNKKTEVQ